MISLRMNDAQWWTYIPMRTDHIRQVFQFEIVWRMAQLNADRLQPNLHSHSIGHHFYFSYSSHEQYIPLGTIPILINLCIWCRISPTKAKRALFSINY